VEIFLIVDLYLEVEIMLGMLLCQGQGMPTVASLPTHAYGDVHIEVHLSILQNWSEYTGKPVPIRKPFLLRFPYPKM
jgi:hypothetical protein